MATMSKSDGDARDFAMSFVAASDRFRQPFIERQREVVANFVVEPTYGDEVGRVRSPYRREALYRDPRNQIILKSPETHEIVMTYASKLVRTLFGERNKEYVKAKPRGWEDAPLKAGTATRYLRYVFGLPGHFRTFVEAIVDMLLFGTSIVEVGYHYEEREQLVRIANMELGIEFDEWQRMRVPVYDDPRISGVDIFDFYPDPSRYRLQDMSGCAKRFRMTAWEARAMAKKGIYNAAMVEDAIRGAGKQSVGEPYGDSFRQGLDQPPDRKAPDEFKEMIGYEYSGDVPWETEQASARGVVTVLNNFTVRNDEWPWADPALPFKSFIINPVQGRFYGLSPADVVRYTQEFMDALLVLTAKAVIRQVHPPIAYDPDSEIDLAKLLTWKPDVLIGARGGPAAAGTLRYDADIPAAFNLLAGLGNMAKSGSGATGALRGEEGPDREAATAAQFRVQGSMDRPELVAMVIEQDCLPSIGQSVLRRGQQFLDMEGLKQRIGEMPESAWIGDIMGDFDLEFVGSRVAMSRQEKMQAYDRLMAMGAAIPQFRVRVPWDALAAEFIGEVLELPEVAAQMTPANALMNAQLDMVLGGAGGQAQNGVPPSPEAPGLPASQAAGAEAGA